MRAVAGQDCKTIPITGEETLSAEVLIRREQIAAQVVAVMRAHFGRPRPEEMRQILRCAEGQITALTLAPFLLS